MGSVDSLQHFRGRIAFCLKKYTSIREQIVVVLKSLCGGGEGRGVWLGWGGGMGRKVTQL